MITMAMFSHSKHKCVTVTLCIISLARIMPACPRIRCKTYFATPVREKSAGTLCQSQQTDQRANRKPARSQAKSQQRANGANVVKEQLHIQVSIEYQLNIN
jgi:hypothetical protein